MKRRFLLLPVVLLAPLTLNVEAAGSLQGQLGIQIIIGAGCTVNNGTSDTAANNFGNITFGSYPSLANNIDAQSVGASAGSSFGIECANATNYSVALNSGLNNSGTQRRMASGGNYVLYNLYKDAARSDLWGNNNNGGTALAGVGNGANQDIVVYGRVPNQITPATGTYTDTVQVTITW